MPVYEYRCNDCEHEFELIQRITAPARGTCPSCGSSRVHRLISLTSFQLKGSGWYVTDYAGKKGSNGSNGKDHKDHPEPGPTSAAKAEAAAPAKSEADASSTKAEPTKAATSSPSPAPPS